MCRPMPCLKVGFFNIGTLGVMYVYGFDLFFDFCGLFDVCFLAVSNLMGIKSPINFGRPFKPRDLKEFWIVGIWVYLSGSVILSLYASRDALMRTKIQEPDYHPNMSYYQYVGHGLLARGDLVLHAYGLFHGLGLLPMMLGFKKRPLIKKEKAKDWILYTDNRWTKV